MRERPQYFGWHDPRRGYLVSRLPPDAPVRASTAYESAEEATSAIERKRAKILWFPPLPKAARS